MTSDYTPVPQQNGPILGMDAYLVEDEAWEILAPNPESQREIAEMIRLGRGFPLTRPKPELLSVVLTDHGHLEFSIDQDGRERVVIESSSAFIDTPLLEMKTTTEGRVEFASDEDESA